MRLLLQHNIPFERTEELLAQDPYQKGLYFITQELKNRADEFGMVLFAKHEEFVGRVIRRVLFLDFVEKHPDVHVRFPNRSFLIEYSCHFNRIITLGKDQSLYL